MSHDARFVIPPGVARKLARGADDNANAIVVGNRAGVIEWANDAWTRVTGYALDESISKPVLSFLRNAGARAAYRLVIGRSNARGAKRQLRPQLQSGAQLGPHLGLMLKSPRPGS